MKWNRLLCLLLSCACTLSAFIFSWAEEPAASSTSPGGIITSDTAIAEPAPAQDDPGYAPAPELPSAPWTGQAPWDIQYHWAGDYIYTLMTAGLMTGYEDGRFRPDQTITKQELLYLLVSYARHTQLVTEEHIEELAKTVECPRDLTELWAETAVRYLIKESVVSTDQNGNIEPDKVMTREQIALTLFFFKEKVEDYPFVPEPNGYTFTDVESSEAKSAIGALCREGILTGYEDGTFRPDRSVTRAEAAAILVKMAELPVVAVERTIPSYNVISVPYISQLYPVSAPVGCEGTSLLMGLHSKGYASGVDLKTFLDALPKHTSDPAKGFVGSPYKPDKTKAIRTTIFPAKLTEFGKQYGKVTDLSGSTVKELQAEVLYGNPVVVYATMKWERPFYRYYDVEGVQKPMLSNNHVVLLSGYDAATNRYFISDPYNIGQPGKELKYWIDGTTFEWIYNERRQAVAVE